MKFKSLFLSLSLLALGNALQAQFINNGPTRLSTTDSVGVGGAPGCPLHVFGAVAANGSLAYLRATSASNGGSALTLEMPPVMPGLPVGNHHLLRGVVNNQNVFSINRLGSADFNGSLQVGGRTTLAGNTIVTGSNNDGQTATLELRSGTERMLLDGNEIDGVTHGLHLNNNTNQNVFINRGGGRTLFGAGSAPTAKVEIRHNATYGNPALEITEESTDYARIYFRNVTHNTRRFSMGGNPGAQNPRFNISFNEGTGTHDILVVDGEQRSVGIGTASIPSGYRLAIDGRLICEEVRVQFSSQWPDYVFTPTYRLMPWQELERNIWKNGHLPGIPSAKEVQENGLSVGDMQAKTMEKVEELFLYMIELKKENEALKAAIEQLKN